MLSTSFTDMSKISAVLESFEQSVNYDEFGNTLKDISTTEYDYSNSIYDGETMDNHSITEDGSVIRNSATSSKHLMKSSQNDYSEPPGQCRLLLVSLLDNFCSMYDRNPRKNQKLFSSLCRKLSTMGLLKSLDFMEESKSIRSIYKEAFKAIVVEAVNGIDASDKADRLSARSPLLHSEDEDSSNSITALVEQHTFNHFLNNTNENNSIPSSALGEEIFLSGRSRYREDFVEGAVLGRGGYGKVVVAVNKLDGNNYAIKKINFSGVSSTRFTRILREVKSLARLDHPNIVRYNSAWIEDHSTILERIKSTDPEHDNHMSIVHELENVKHDFDAESKDSVCKLKSLSIGAQEEGDDDDDDEDTFMSGSSDDEYVSHAPHAIDHASDYASEHTHVFHAPSIHSDHSVSDYAHIRNNQNTPSQNAHPNNLNRHSPLHNYHKHRFQFQDRKIMYIQMELCRFTLDQYIKARNKFYFECSEELNRTGTLSIENLKMVLQDQTERSHVIPAENLFTWDGKSKELSLNPVELDTIFKGIVKGLHYIHENGMIHRDLKPMNIFFHQDLSPKIGDFGLVSEIKCSCGFNCGVGSAEDFVSSSTSGAASPMMEYTKGVGTVTYASPEQLNQEDYTQKSDIYSLGIICFELFYPVATQMERTRILADLKHSHKFPEDFLKQWPKEAAFIWSCIARDSVVRPSTHEILESEWLERDEDEIISRLEVELLLARKREDELIKSLEEILKENLLLKRSLKTEVANKHKIIKK